MLYIYNGRRSVRYQKLIVMSLRNIILRCSSVSSNVMGPKEEKEQKLSTEWRRSNLIF